MKIRVRIPNSRGRSSQVKVKLEASEEVKTQVLVTASARFGAVRFWTMGSLMSDTVFVMNSPAK